MSACVHPCVHACELTATKIAPGPCRVSSQPYSQKKVAFNNASNKLLIIYPKTRFVPKTWFSLSCSKERLHFSV